MLFLISKCFRHLPRSTCQMYSVLHGYYPLVTLCCYFQDTQIYHFHAPRKAPHVHVKFNKVTFLDILPLLTDFIQVYLGSSSSGTLPILT